MPVLTITAQRGGCAKTTTAQALAYCFAHALKPGQKAKCLLVDMDPQGSLTMALGLDSAEDGILDAMLGRKRAGEAIKAVSGAIDAIPAGDSLIGGEMELYGRGDSAGLLAKALAPVQGGYALTIIDTPPSLGILTVASLMASTHALIVGTAEIMSLSAIGKTAHAIRQVQGAHQVEIAGILITRLNERHRVDRAAIAAAKASAENLGIPILGSVSESVGIREAQANQAPFSIAIRAMGDYTRLWPAILERIVKS